MKNEGNIYFKVYDVKQLKIKDEKVLVIELLFLL